MYQLDGVEFSVVSKSQRGLELQVDLHDQVNIGAASVFEAVCDAAMNLGRETRASVWVVSSSVRQYVDKFSRSLSVKASKVAETGEGVVWRVDVFSNDEARVLEADFNGAVRVREEQAAAPSQVESELKDASPTVVRLGEKLAVGASTADKRRLQIFNGACDVISKKGYGDASIRDIAKVAKVSIPMMYQYVENKEDLLYLITSTCMSDIISYFQEELDETLAPVAAIENAIDAYLRYIDVNRKYINLVYSETRALSEENRQKVFHLEKRFLKLWENILKRGVSSGDFSVGDTDLAANFIYFLCTVWSLRFWSIGHADPELVRAEITKLVLKGILSKV